MQVAGAGAFSTPDNHFGPSPDGGVKMATIGRAGGSRGNPIVCARIISAASIETCAAEIESPAPHDHFSASPDGRVNLSGEGRVSSACSCPTIRAGIVSAAIIEDGDLAVATADDHFSASPYCGVPIPLIRCASDGRGNPTVGAGIVSAPSV